MIDVWAHRHNTDHAQAFVQELQSQGRAARECNSRWFDPQQIDTNVVHAYHDGTRRGIAEAYRERGIACELIPGIEALRVEDMPASDYEIVYRAPWYSVVGPEGKVGKSVRTEDEAQAILSEVTGADD
jgi:hypothetical protein